MLAIGNRLILVLWLLSQTLGFAHPVSSWSSGCDVTGFLPLAKVQVSTYDYDEGSLQLEHDLAVPSTTMAILNRSNEVNLATLAYDADPIPIFFEKGGFLAAENTVTTAGREAGNATQLDLIKQDSIGRWWGVRGDSGTMRPIGGIQTGIKGVHGNSALSSKTAYLYRLEDRATGAHLKWGITDDPSPYGRYKSDFLKDKLMFIEDQGPRSLMLQIERDMVEIDPGLLNNEPWAGEGLP